jgi:hypothetical protein
LQLSFNLKSAAPPKERAGAGGYRSTRRIGMTVTVTSPPNEAAQQDRFTIPTNMRVPEASVIHRLFVDEGAGDGSGREDLSWWESQGKKQEGRVVAVEARRVADRVIAVVQPVEPVRQLPQGPKEKGLFEE